MDAYKDLPKKERQKMYNDAKNGLTTELADAEKVGNVSLIKEINKKLDSLKTVFHL